MVRSGISFCEVHRQADRCCHRSSVHGTGGICNDQSIGSCLYVIRQLTPLGFQYVIFLDSDSTPAHFHDLFNNVVRKQRCRVDCLRATCRLPNELAETVCIMLHECISVDHHGSGRNRRVADLIPASRGHECFHHADLLTHRTDEALELIY